ncbi:hypothetical protein B1813_05785 [Saccharomonospora piscinae]|uniref:Uncharacterized protein n=1 Tax=Saccharomonospora piscinae TaxID=687388 RepID=A0A1V9AAK7_SACPI|nr:hypothetical protein B1813_05785 [Saccharomonospora piscinae]TLW95397.1 hypothetical protein FFT09_04940 [Saccharomonospora piscinae]
MIAATALLAATACGEQTTAQNQPGAGAEPPPASQELSRAPEDVPHDGPVPMGQIDSAALPEGYPLDVAVSEQGRTLTIVAQEGGCTKASATVEEQTERKVAITLVESKPADKNVACTMDMRYPPLTVELEEPLSDRKVVLDHETSTH